MKRHSPPSLERIKELLRYEPETGSLFWRKSHADGVKAGAVAGSRSGRYVRVCVDNVSYRAHRIIWLLMTNEWPMIDIDHVDRNKHNNKWINLRLATRSHNNANSGVPRHNKSGFKGVSRYRQGESWGKPWQAGIMYQGKGIHLGHFPTAELARAAYCEAAERLFGEFARSNKEEYVS